MKKKLLLSTHTLNIGGVERSFIGLLEAIDYTKYDVDVFVYKHGGDLFHLIPKQANILPEIKTYAALLEPISQVLKKGLLSIAFAKVLARVKTKIKEKILTRDSSKNDSIAHPVLYDIAQHFLPKISDKEYDAVLAFLHPNYFEQKKVNAKKYLAWIHTDYSFLNIDPALELKMWKAFDQIFAVSDANKETFVQVFPTLKTKVDVFENILSEKFVRKQSMEDISGELTEEKGILSLLSIGRYSVPKNFESIPEISAHLQRKGLCFKWYIIGYGSPEEEQKIISAIRVFKMENQVILLGKKNNPYPYIKACDWYIQPSRFEGKAVTVREAQMLGKPVIITDFPSSKSQLHNGYDGWVVSLDNKKAAEEIFNIVSDYKKIQNIIKNLKKEDYSNFSEIKKLNQLLNV